MPMSTPTLIDWSEVRSRVLNYRNLYGHETDSRALAHIVLESEHGFPPEDAMDAITDGEDDRGIDAVYIDDAEPTSIVHLYQVKYVDTFEKTKNNFPSNDIDKVHSYLTDVVQKNPKLQKSINALLWQKTLAIWQEYEKTTPSLVVHFCGNQAELLKHHRDRLVTWLAQYRITFRQHTLSSLVIDLIARATPRIDHKLKLVDNQYFERVDGTLRGLIATVEANELMAMIRDPNNPDSVRRAIFNANVPVYLTSRNEINKKIVASALSDENADFWYLNNGITITCDSMRYPPGTRAPTLELTNVQIVNGGQTSNALFEAYRSDPGRVKRVLLLVRVYETRAPEISQLIAATTNSQTPVRSRDLRANDEIQKKLADAFAQAGYYYERKENQHKDKPADRRIDALVAGRAYVAYYMDQPDIAKRAQRRIFGDLYPSVFNDSILPEKLLAPFALHAALHARKLRVQSALRKNETFDEAELVLLEGVYQVLNACRFRLEVQGLDEDSVGAGMEMVNPAVQAVYDVAAADARKERAAFSLTRFFKDKRTTKKVHAAISERVRQGTLPGIRKAGT